MPQELSYCFEAAGLGVEQDFCAQVAELVWCKHDASSSLQIIRDKPCDRRLALRTTIRIKNHQLSWWFDGEPLKAVLKDSATFGMGLWDH